MEKKKYDKVRLEYETSVNQLKSGLKKNKQNIKLINELELKKEIYEEAFQQTSTKTNVTLASTIAEHQFTSLESFSYYLEAFYGYFMNGYEYVKDLKPLLTQTKQLVHEVVSNMLTIRCIKYININNRGKKLSKQQNKHTKWRECSL